MMIYNDEVARVYLEFLDEMTDHTVPILFVTALCDRQTVTLCRNLDAAGYIVRPYKPVFVKTEIKRILMGRSEIE